MQRANRKRLTRILIILANPKGTLSLRLTEELRLIEEKLRQGKGRGRFVIRVASAFTISDLMRELVEYEPDIVHFCGHGAGTDGIVCEDETGEMRLIPTDGLVSLFKTASHYVKCVLLIACFSEIQAEALVQDIDFVVGMRGSISDRAALAYVLGFYTALFAGKDFPACHEFGKTAIQLSNIPEYLTPILKVNDRARPARPAGFVRAQRKSNRSRPKPAKTSVGSPLPGRLGRRSFLTTSIITAAGSLTGWYAKAMAAPTFPLDGLYLQDLKNGFPSADEVRLSKLGETRSTGFIVQSYYCEVAVTHDVKGYHLVETTYNRLMLIRLDCQVIGVYVSTAEWEESGRVDSTNVTTTLAQIDRHGLSDIRFDKFARQEVDVKGFEDLQTALADKYGPGRSARWEMQRGQLVETSGQLVEASGQLVKTIGKRPLQFFDRKIRRSEWPIVKG